MNKALISGIMLVACGGACAQQYDFVAAPHTALNRIYRVDKVTGEVGACQFNMTDSGIGATMCFPAGEGARAGQSGDYGLLSSNHATEAGIFRINRRTGDVSVCYVLNDEQVVCTPQAR